MYYTYMAVDAHTQLIIIIHNIHASGCTCTLENLVISKDAVGNSWDIVYAILYQNIIRTGLQSE